MFSTTIAVYSFYPENKLRQHPRKWALAQNFSVI